MYLFALESLDKQFDLRWLHQMSLLPLPIGLSLGKCGHVNGKGAFQNLEESY